MGIRIEFGGVRSIFSYLNPRRGNPFVLTWFGLVIALWILGFYWLFFAAVRNFLAEHPGMFHGIPNNPAAIRFFYCLMVSGGILGLVFMCVADFPGFIK